MPYALQIKNAIQLESIEKHKIKVKRSVTPNEERLIKEGKARIIKIKIVEIPSHRPKPRKVQST